jgi:hypothetical protein
MMLRFVNLVVIGALVLAAAHVYRIKFDSTVQAERLAKLRGEVRHERDAIAALRAEWGQLDNPQRIEALANRYLHLKPIAPTQFDALDHLPERPSPAMRADSADPIGGVIENSLIDDPATGSITAPPSGAMPGGSSGPASGAAKQ